MLMKNIVMIYCDELRCDALSCYGSPYGIKTENIDELYAHSVSCLMNATVPLGLCAFPLFNLNQPAANTNRCLS